MGHAFVREDYKNLSNSIWFTLYLLASDHTMMVGNIALLKMEMNTLIQISAQFVMDT